MNKLVTLLVGLVMATFNVFAAVNVNTATQEQLESLNGIGPAKAKAIIDYRQKNGGFKTLEDIDKVPGIGAGIMGKIKNDVTLTGETTVKVAAKQEPRISSKKAEATRSAPAPKAEPVKVTPTAAPAVKAGEPKGDSKNAEVKAEKKTAARTDKEAKKAEREAKKAEKKH